MKRVRRSAPRRNDDNPDDFQPHNRAAAAVLAAGAVGCAIAGIAICLATHRFRWAGLVANNLAVLMAIAALVLRRSRLGYCVVALAILAFFASMLVPRWVSAVG
jgi:hypothetical protein